MLVYVIIVLILVFAIYKERQALGCPNIPNGQDCDNAHGKALKDTEPSETDTTDQLFGKVKTASCFMDRWVTWRLALITSAIGTIIIWFFLFSRFPSEVEWSVGIFVTSAIIYFTLNFYKFHMVDYIEHNIDASLSLLRKRTTVL